jgi:flagellar L-ring protein precursor FlgH
MPTRPFKRSFEALALVTVAATLAGAPAHAKRAKPKPGFEVTLPLPAPAPPADGSIFQASNGYAGLHEGMRARAVGDPLMVVLLERVSSTKSATSKTERDGHLALIPPTAGPLGFLNPNALAAGGNSEYDGKGSAAQTRPLEEQSSDTIAQLFGNGTALVRGEKRLTLSQGEEWVQFSGIIRLADVDQSNRIASTQVADARIEYSGNGQVARASREGWLQRFFNMITPF